MRYDVAKIFDLGPGDRSSCQFSDTTKIRLPEEWPHGITLKASASGVYPTDSDIYARGPLFSPTGVRQWVAFDADMDLPKDTLGVQVTSVGWKINDGTDDRWWDGASWAVAGASDWNTLAEIQAHFSTFPVTSRSIRFVANLVTTDERYAPTLQSARFLYKCELRSFSDAVIYRSLIPAMKAGVAPQTDITLEWPGGATYDLDSLSQEEPLTISDVDGAYNYDDDSDLVTNLKSSYNTGTKVLTLTGAVDAGTNVLLRVAYTPQIVVVTHSDFQEIAATPAIELSAIREDLVGEERREIAFIDRNTGDAVIVPAPRQTDYTMDVTCRSPREVECSSMVESILKWLNSIGRTLTIGVLDQDVSIVLQGDPVRSDEQQSNLHEAMFTMKVVGATKWLDSSSAGYAIQRVVITGDMNVTLT